jgi:hypothetical protein
MVHIFVVGDPVKTPYGEGVVVDVRHNQIVVQPSAWHMAGGQKATLFLNLKDVKPLFKVGDCVRTLFGVGNIIDIRDHGVPFVIRLQEWKLASMKSPVLYLGEHSLKLEREDALTFKQGDYVHTTYGTGRVMSVRDSDQMVIVQPDNWLMDRKKIPTFYLKADTIKKIEEVVPSPPEPTKTFEEKFALVKANKDEGTKLFKAGQFEAAKEKYAETINNLNYLSDTASDEQRSHLFEQTLSCHSNLAVCFLRLQRYTECFNMARSTLYLVDSFENLYPHSKMWQHLLSRGFSIETLLKVWKKKALYLMGKSAVFKQDFQDAVKYLTQAHALIAHDPRLTADAKDIVELISQSTARLNKQNKAEKNMWKKAFSKQVEEEAETTKLVNDIMGGPISSDSPAPTPLASPAAVASTGASGSVGSKKKLTKKKSEKKKKKEEAASSWNIPIIATAAAALAIAGVVWLRSRRS